MTHSPGLSGSVQIGCSSLTLEQFNPTRALVDFRLFPKLNWVIKSYYITHTKIVPQTFIFDNPYCTTPRKLVVYAPMGAQPLRSCVPFNGRAVSYHSQQWHDVTITALRISVDLRDLLAHRNCFVNEIRVTLWSCALAIFSQEGEKIKFYSSEVRDSYQSPSISLIFEVLYNTNG